MIYLIGFVAFVSLGFNIMLIDEMLKFKDYVFKVQKITLDMIKDLMDALESSIVITDEKSQGD